MTAILAIPFCDTTGDQVSKEKTLLGKRNLTTAIQNVLSAVFCCLVSSVLGKGKIKIYLCVLGL